MKKTKSLYSIEQYNSNKSTIYLNLGNYYETKFENENKRNPVLLDSAFYFYKKTILFSFENTKNKIAAQLNMANIFLYKNQIKEAEKTYQNVVTEAKENNLNDEHRIAIYNLGHF